MSRKLSLIALVAALSIVSTQSVHAQLGKYQQGLVNAVSQGAAVGGDAAGVPGAIVGGVAAAGYYDTQHQGQVVHDHRAPRVNWSRFEYGHGAFLQQGRQWVEYQNGRQTFVFQERVRTPHLIELVDPSRNITVRIQNGSAIILLPGQNWQFLYNGRNF